MWSAVKSVSILKWWPGVELRAEYSWCIIEELPELNYIINADFPVNLSLYLNRMRSGVKRYISIFIAEDARHADRLIYVLNESGQEVPPILYKISEAYVNSGKDVDRMPSRKHLFAVFLGLILGLHLFVWKVQEISDGLTKPVEKPIPKPLPPTVHLNTNNVTTAKRPLEEKMKQMQPSNGSHKNSTYNSNNYSNHKKLKNYSSNTTNNYSNSYKNHVHSHHTSNIQNPYLNPNNMNQNFFFNSNNYQLTQNIIKIEPTETTAYMPQTQPYFTQPIEFKQEPTDYADLQSFNHPSSQQQTEQQAQSSSSLVSHLLKDKQVLNLLDKVAQTFRPPTQSMYQVFILSSVLLGIIWINTLAWNSFRKGLMELSVIYIFFARNVFAYFWFLIFFKTIWWWFNEINYKKSVIENIFLNYSFAWNFKLRCVVYCSCNCDGTRRVIDRKSKRSQSKFSSIIYRLCFLVDQNFFVVWFSQTFWEKKNSPMLEFWGQILTNFFHR